MELKDKLLTKYATADGVSKGDDDSETAELFKQVLQEHAKMKRVLLNELIDGNVRQTALESSYTDEPRIKEVIDLALKHEVQAALSQERWESERYQYVPDQNIFNEDLKPQTKSMDRLMRSSF